MFYVTKTKIMLRWSSESETGNLWNFNLRLGRDLFDFSRLTSSMSLKLILITLVTFKNTFFWFSIRFFALFCLFFCVLTTSTTLRDHFSVRCHGDACSFSPHTIFLLAVANLWLKGNPEQLEKKCFFWSLERGSRELKKNRLNHRAYWSGRIFGYTTAHSRWKCMEYWWLFSELISVMNWRASSTTKTFFEFLEFLNPIHIAAEGVNEVKSNWVFHIHNSTQSYENWKCERENEENSLVV